MANQKVAVIGGGPGGYGAAFMAADLGLDVVLIDPEENPGGVCLYRGCIPSKALLHVAHLILETRASQDLGIGFSEPDIDVDRIREWKDQVVKKLTGGVGQLSKYRKIEHIRGVARFNSSTELVIQLNDGKEKKLSFDKAILASGSVPAMLPGVEKTKRVWDSSDALDIPGIPDSLLVVGGGYIGLELGTFYATLGSTVTVAEMMPGLLPGVDPDLTRIFQKHNKDLFEAFLLKTKVNKLEEQKQGIKVTLEKEGGEKETKRFSNVLVAIGRKPRTDSLGLENTDVQLDDKGFIKVDAQRRTDDASIYAIGDVAGEPMLAHKATHEGRVAAEAIAGKKSTFDPAAIPAVVFTIPEIAWTGLTEPEAKEKGKKIKTGKFPWAASGRAITLGGIPGMTKLIIDSETERVLGMSMVGMHAGELIAEGTLAVEMAALASDMGMTIHPHPTLSETVMEAADTIYQTSTHYYSRKK